jgi:hypothetical protein
VTGLCAREFRACDQPAGGYRGKFPALCWKHARDRMASIEMLRRNRRRALLSGAR